MSELRRRITHTARGLWIRLWWLIDSDSVRPFIWFYYAPLLVFGFYSGLYLPHNVVDLVLGDTLGQLWAWIQVPATVSAMVGLAMRHGGTSIEDMSRVLLFRDWMGLWLQLAGHLCMNQVLLAYEVCAFSFVGTMYWGHMAFGPFAISSYVFGTFILTLQCGRKIARGLALGACS